MLSETAIGREVIVADIERFYFPPQAGRLSAVPVRGTLRRQAFLAALLACGAALAAPRRVSGGVLRKVLHDDVLFEPRPRGPLSRWSAPGATERRTLAVTTPDGVTLRGWFYPAPTPGPTILYFYGNGGSLDESALRAGWLASLGYNVALFDYRGYGYSEGTPHLTTIAIDSVSLYDFVSKMVGGESMFVYGWSLGTTFAVRLAVSRPVRALILQAPPASAAEELAALRLPLIARAAFTLVPDDTIVDGVANAKRIAAYRGPLLVLHGAADDVVPIVQGREVFDACPHRRSNSSNSPAFTITTSRLEIRSPVTLSHRSLPSIGDGIPLCRKLPRRNLITLKQ